MAKTLTDRERDELLQKIQIEQRSGLKSFNGRLAKVEAKIQEFHDFMIVQIDRQGRPDGTAQWQDLLKKALTVLGVSLGIMSALIAAYLKVTSR